MSRIALLSVADKTGIVELAQALVATHGFTIISSGGTAKTLKAAGMPVMTVPEHTGAPEMLGGRVKTLHPRIHGGILARRDVASDVADLAAQAIPAIELVVVNLYPFEATVARLDVTLADAIEQIDIGGPTLVRAAAKNYAHVSVLTNPAQYEAYLAALAAGETSLEQRWQWSRAAFERIVGYDVAIANYLAQQDSAPAPLCITGTVQQSLRYGENPQQPATWYRLEDAGWSTATQLQGKELSYNNLLDLEAARAIAADLPTEAGQAGAVIIKHTNPCGVAIATDLATAYRRALAADSVSAFGGIVALTQPLDVATAQALSETFLECVVAPAVDAAALNILAIKKNLRVLVLPDFQLGVGAQYRAIAGGLLVQAPDTAPEPGWQVVTTIQPSEAQWADLRFAWHICRFVKSNAIVVAKDLQTLGVGAGQMNRVGAAAIALNQAGAQAQGAVLASDGFFPFADSVTTAVAAGIAAIIQPGGSIRDAESIKAADAARIPMLFTGTRHFLH